MSPEPSKDYRKLYKKIGYQFQQPELLKTALTHSSHGKKNNERLEFLGDAVLGWIISEALYDRFPNAKEGELSRLRSRLVKGDTLAEVADELGISEHLRLGQGEMKSGGNRRRSTLADAVEAIIGAIFLDADISVCKKTVLAWMASRLKGVSLEANLKDPKTRLQEFLQSRKLSLPSYEIVATEGKDHDQVFTVSCTLDALDKAITAKGKSRRRAEQAAATEALAVLGAK